MDYLPTLLFRPRRSQPPSATTKKKPGASPAVAPIPTRPPTPNSSDSSDLSEDEPSIVTCQTAISAVHGTVNQDALQYVEGVVDSFPDATQVFKTAADNGYSGETIPISSIEVVFETEARSEEAPQVHTGGGGSAKIMSNEALRIQAESADVSLPKEASTSGVRRSSRKRNEVLYNEAILAGQLPRKAPAKHRKVESPKKKPTTCMGIRSNYFPSDSDEDDESE